MVYWSTRTRHLSSSSAKSGPAAIPPRGIRRSALVTPVAILGGKRIHHQHDCHFEGSCTSSQERPNMESACADPPPCRILPWPSRPTMSCDYANAPRGQVLAWTSNGNISVRITPSPCECPTDECAEGASSLRNTLVSWFALVLRAFLSQADLIPRCERLPQHVFGLSLSQCDAFDTSRDREYSRL